MPDFGNLTALAVTKATTREYTFTDIEGEPSVIVSPATDDNEDYLNARLELALAEVPAEEERATRKRLGGKLSVADLKAQYEESREIDRKVMAKACLRSWGTPPVDVKGEPVEFSEANAYEFLKALPDWLLDPLRNFCGNVRNFKPKPKANGEALGKS